MQDDVEPRDAAPVVVTGAHRSGTTLLGDIVSHSPGSWTVWEPFNRHWGLRDVRRFYPYLRRSQPPEAPVAALARYLATGRARWSVKAGRGGPVGQASLATVRGVRRWWEWRRHVGAMPVVKDPFLLLALDAVQPLVTPRPVVVSVRHPCSWVLSLRRMSWPAGPELNALIAQEELYDQHLGDLLPRRDWTRSDPLEAGARAWTCLYHMVNVQVAHGARALLVPLESFGRDPGATVQTMYSSLQLPVPADLGALSRSYTDDTMAVTPQGTTMHLLQRNSRELNDAWKQKLTREQADLVRRITEPVYASVYDGWDEAGGVARTL